LGRLAAFPAFDLDHAVFAGDPCAAATLAFEMAIHMGYSTIIGRYDKRQFAKSVVRASKAENALDPI